MGRSIARWLVFGRVPRVVAPVLVPSSRARLVLERLCAVPAERQLLPPSSGSFSAWWRARSNRRLDGPNGEVVVFPTCLVERRTPGIGRDLVHVYERHGIACTVPDAIACCGRPDRDDARAFRGWAASVVALLAPHARRGRDVVVPDRSCAAVLRTYGDRLGTDDARLVASAVRDASRPLARTRDQGERGPVARGPVPAAVVLHVPPGGDPGDDRALLESFGADVDVVTADLGVGTDASRYDEVRRAAEPLRRRLEGDGHDAVVGSCLLSNAALEELTGERVLHPLQVVARALGLPEDI